MIYAKFRLCALLCVILVILPLTVRCQDPPIEWEEIPRADLEMNTYAPDTSASAVVLADYGKAMVNSELGITFWHHRRIKIFSPAGYRWGAEVVTLYTKNHGERLSDLEGATYSLRPDGSIAKTELEDNAIFKEEADKEHTNYRFTLPALQPGCVIEYRYRVTAKDWGIMPTWRFQHAIPTVWSEYRIIVPSAMEYAKVAISYEPFFINEQKTERIHIGGNNFITGGVSTTCIVSRTVMRDLPALREEPYITTMDDYTPQVRYQLSGYASPYGPKRVMKTWEELTQELLKLDDFGDRLDATRKVKELAQRITAGLGTQTAKMIAIYDYVRATMVWNGNVGILAEDLDDLLETKKGDTGDINLLLMAMLRCVGVDVDPVLASTRSHGMVTDVYPLVDQFNVVAARVTVDGKTYVLDATDPLRPYDLVDPDLLNVNGFVIREGSPTWSLITCPQHYVHHATARMDLGPEGDIRGTLTSVDEKYSALLKRRTYRDGKPLDMAKQVFDAERIGLQLDSVVVSGKDTSAGPLTIEAGASGTGYAQVSGDYIYYNPLVIDRSFSSPFKLQKRNFPIDMSYAREAVCLTLVHTPPGYQVKEIPRDVTLGGGDLEYSRFSIVSHDSVETMTRFKVLATVFPPSAYPEIKSVYDKIVAAESEQVVLKKKLEPTPQTEPAAPQKKKTKGGKRR
jgi:transglutaminase-like putative cysteine protease